MKSKLSFKEAYFLISHGLSSRDSEKITGISSSTISLVNKNYGLNKAFNKNKLDNYRFNKIDTKEKAYALGFILADAGIDDKLNVDLKVSIGDKEAIEFISKEINSRVFDNSNIDRKRRQFPHSRTSKRIKDITKFTGGKLKKDRHYPRISKDLEPYLLQGFFDGDGCITWGHRKDRDRLWHKVCFTSSLSILIGLQQYLYKQDIVTTVRPKSNENCFVLEFANKKDILKFYNLVYQDKDFIILKRKYIKYSALRLELEENGEGYESK